MSLEILNNPLIGNSFSKVLEKNNIFNDSLNKLSKNNSNEYALGSPLRKESIFYKAEEGSYRSFLEKKGKYIAIKKLFNDIDLEKIGFTEIYDKINIKYQ
ncbi:hypothetical protein GCM10022217_32540 [Chryseobacterium ginsenosidimutans]|uniref:hypothetical protein n=1 Tax=Chryseobacterium ginsenosidimutans TaxID=687846 RepID=UPI0031DE089C